MVQNLQNITERWRNNKIRIAKMQFPQALQTYTQIFYNIFGIIGFASFVIVCFTYIVYRKQLNIMTMSRCIDRFRKDFLYLKTDHSSDKKKIFEYVDFVNEECFYFENGYIPYNAIVEWVDGMIEIMPIYCNGIVANNEQCLLAIHENQMLNKFKRVKKAFTIKNKYNFDGVYKTNTELVERDKLIEEIIGNLGVSKPLIK